MVRGPASLYGRQVFCEAIQRAGPTTPVRIARRDRLEDALVQGQLRLPLVLLEGHRQQRFGTSGLACRICPVPVEDESFRLDDLAKGALRPMVGAFGRTHVDSIGAARADIE